jgi:anti-sigma regulatory factor (Ser/Thr protein kinase)
MIDHLRSLDALLDMDLSGVEQIFGELYMNVCQHSGFNGGLIYIPDVEDNDYITIIVADLGKGIPGNIKICFPEYSEKSDIDAIEFATNDWITTKSTPQNYGRGLAHLLTISDALQGEVTIISGQGKLIRSNNENQKLPFDEYFPGTLISAKLNLRNFEKQEKQLFDENVDF